MKDQISFEELLEKKPVISHVRIFGCDAYIHVPKEKMTKLDSKSEKCTLLGTTMVLKCISYEILILNVLSTTGIWCSENLRQIIPQVPKKSQAVELNVDLKKWIKIKQART